jgi:hypothetical protein
VALSCAPSVRRRRCAQSARISCTVKDTDHLRSSASHRSNSDSSGSTSARTSSVLFFMRYSQPCAARVWQCTDCAAQGGNRPAKKIATPKSGRSKYPTGSQFSAGPKFRQSNKIGLKGVLAAQEIDFEHHFAPGVALWPRPDGRGSRLESRLPAARGGRWCVILRSGHPHALPRSRYASQNGAITEQTERKHAVSRSSLAVEWVFEAWLRQCLQRVVWVVFGGLVFDYRRRGLDHSRCRW